MRTNEKENTRKNGRGRTYKKKRDRKKELERIREKEQMKSDRIRNNKYYMMTDSKQFNII